MGEDSTIRWYEYRHRKRLLTDAEHYAVIIGAIFSVIGAMATIIGLFR